MCDSFWENPFHTKNKNGLGKLGLKKEWKRVYEVYHLDKGGKNMSIFQELKEKIVFPPNWKDNLMAHKKYEKLYKKNPTKLIYSNMYRTKSMEKID